MLNINFQEYEFEETDVLDQETNKLTVFNDDYNTFHHVTETLMKVCGHTLEQADQCTLIIHYKGKCVVKEGEFEKLVAMRNAICEKGISAEVD